MGRLSIIINLVRNGIGTYKEILELEKMEGLEFLQEIVSILAIISQEEEMDRNAQN